MDTETEFKIQTRFEKHAEFVALQDETLSLDISPQASDEESNRRINLMRDMVNILAEYQEQAYLLDPFLEELVGPVVKKFKFYAQGLTGGSFSLEDIANLDTGLELTAPLTRVSYLLYNYLKFRGYKTIIRFFPHEVSDLAVALEFAQILNRAQSSTLWSTQHVALLWISLICMIPFDLAQFDEAGREGQTAAIIEAIAKQSLTSSGIVRDSAAILLSRLYVRKDVLPRLPAFLDWAKTCAKEQKDIFEYLGVYHTLCQVIKNSPSDVISRFIPDFFEAARSLELNSKLCTNASIRKLRIKILSRAALRLLPVRPRVSLRKGRVLYVTNESDHSEDDGDDDADVPEEIETVLEDLFQGLQDRDTVVRWSAAKGVARISERLPREFTRQVVDTVIGLFSIHTIVIASIYDMPSIAESTWHGACLSCAELLRRGLIPHDRLADVIDWMIKVTFLSLYFDIRKGAHSIGSNVRDAATYALWSLPRAYEASTIAPLSEKLAKNLVSVSTYDREVHIRRAASAAFQEYVGRTGVFPHGIDVLGKIDFFAVGVRRNAFLVAAPQVAEHEEYRPFLIDHLVATTLRHWDLPMRQLGAQSIRKFVRALLTMSDASDVHGGLLALSQLSEAFSTEPKGLGQEVFSYLADVPIEMIRSPRNELVTAAACQLIASSINLKEILLEGQSSVPHWRTIIDLGLKHRKSTVQVAAASALAEVSKLVDCSAVVQRYVNISPDFRSGSPMMQQSLAQHVHALPEAIDCLVTSITPSSEWHMPDVEARRNCMESIRLILTALVPHPSRRLSIDHVVRLYNALISGLDDYTVDDRGDVGSWIRIASIQALTSVSVTLLMLAKTDATYTDYIPADLYQKAIAGILKQGVERLDNVRQQAGESIHCLLKCPLPSMGDTNPWKFHGEELFIELLLSAEDDGVRSHGWQDSAWIFPKAMRFLEVPEYRPTVLSGLLISVGSRTDNTRRHVRNSLVTYANKLPADASDGGHYNLQALVDCLIAEAKVNLSSNSKVIPVLQALNALLEADVLERLCDSEAGTRSARTLLSIASRDVPRLKSVHRIQECMRTVVNLLALPQLSDSCIPQLTDFLVHQYPTIRAETARYLYLFLQSRDIGKDTDDVEELLLETEWFVDQSSHDVTQKPHYRNVDRFSSESDVHEKANIVVDKLREVKDE
ncbi:TBCD protein [Russula aff. rugulosa BPL654]|nr:TBCD protein [Russula aff. rugulosa BPL654]